MGVSFTAYIVVGVYRNQIIEPYTELRPVTRYNELTGEPYTSNIKINRYKLFGEPASDEVCNVYDERGLVGLLQHLGMDLNGEFEDEFVTDYSDDAVFVGKLLYAVGPGDSETVSGEEIERVSYRLTEQLRQAGAKDLQAYARLHMYAG